jgi:hypothetical protein
MPQYARLNTGVHYKTLKVIAIDAVPKAVHKKNDNRNWYAHRIHFEDQNGDKYSGEYLINEPTQNAFEVGQITPFEVDFTGSFIDQVKPLYSATPKDIKKALDAYNSQPLQEMKSHKVSSLSGSPYSFALAYTKDIMVAQIAAGRIVDEKFKEDMFDLAEDCAAWLIGKQQEQITEL